MGNLTRIKQAIQGFSTRWMLVDSNDKEVIFESTTGFNRNWPGQAAEHPVEQGSPLTDHHVKGSQEIRLRMILTTDGIASLRALFQTGVTERSAQLEKWYEDGEILTLAGKDPSEINSLMIESMSEDKDSNLGGARMFDLSLKKVRIADTDAVQVGGGNIRDQEEEAG